jgi:hypothetical protein
MDKEPLTVDDLVYLLRREFDDSIILDKVEIDHTGQKFVVTYRDGKRAKPEMKDFKIGE